MNCHSKGPHSCAFSAPVCMLLNLRMSSIPHVKIQVVGVRMLLSGEVPTQNTGDPKVWCPPPQKMYTSSHRIVL